MAQENIQDVFGPVIYSYTRAQAIEDGELVDVSSVAREAGIKFPVAITIGVYCECVSLPPNYEGPQDERGRLWDVVSMLRFAIQANGGGCRVHFDVRVSGLLHHLWASCGPGDDGEPVITVMLEGED